MQLWCALANIHKRESYIGAFSSRLPATLQYFWSPTAAAARIASACHCVCACCKQCYIQTKRTLRSEGCCWSCLSAPGYNLGGSLCGRLRREHCCSATLHHEGHCFAHGLRTTCSPETVYFQLIHASSSNLLTHQVSKHPTDSNGAHVGAIQRRACRLSRGWQLLPGAAGVAACWGGGARVLCAYRARRDSRWES